MSVRFLWRNQLKHSLLEHIETTQIVILLLCTLAFLSFGPKKNFSIAEQLSTGRIFWILLLLYCAVRGFVDREVCKEIRPVNPGEIISNLLTFILAAVVVISSGGIYSPLKILLLVPVIALSVAHGKLAGLTSASAIGFYLLVASFLSGDQVGPNKVFEENLVFAGVALLVGWLIGGFVDLEVEARKRLSELNEELEQAVADRTKELAAVNRELQNEIAGRRQVESELRAQNRIYDAMHCVLEEASAVSVPHYEDISSLAEMAFSWQSVGYEHAVARRLVEVACEIAGANQGCYYSYDENTCSLNLVHLVGLPGEVFLSTVEGSVFMKGEERGLVGLVAQTKRPIYVSDVRQDTRAADVEPFSCARSSYLLPFYHGEKLFGVLVLLSDQVDGFSGEKRVFADTLASYISTAMENARLFMEMHRAYERLHLIQKQLFQSQKMEAVGQLAGGMAHDLNNQLTVIQGCVDLHLKRVPENDPIHKALIRIRRAAERSVGLTRQLMLFARRHPHFLEPLDLNSALRELQEMFGQMLGGNITLELLLQDDLWTVNADAGNIEQAITNLVINARDAMPQGGRIAIKTENVRFENGHEFIHPEGRPGCFVRLSIEDTGTGMDDEVLSHIFEPFFTTKEPGKGTGLGLSVVYGIVKDHGGWIDVKSRLGEGTVFEIYLPAVAAEPVSDSDGNSVHVSEELRGNGERILLVEADYEVLLLTERILSENGYAVVSCSRACEALEIFEKEKEFSLIISDVILPDGSGIDVIRQMRTSHPFLRGLLISGYCDDRSPVQRIIKGEFHFLPKPFLALDLLRSVRESLDQNRFIPFPASSFACSQQQCQIMTKEG